MQILNTRKRNSFKNLASFGVNFYNFYKYDNYFKAEFSAPRMDFRVFIIVIFKFKTAKFVLKCEFINFH